MLKIILQGKKKANYKIQDSKREITLDFRLLLWPKKKGAAPKGSS